MGKKTKQPWDEKWEQVGDEAIGHGGQGQAHEVKPKTDEFPEGRYVRKILNADNDPERRARMHREVTALKTLKYKGIPKLIDSNVDELKSKVKLYIVTEFIEGLTLEKAIKNATMEPEDAINFVLKLLEIVNYCHQRDIIHRDIKPDNIILRNGDINNPVLIDFGISFNKVDLEETSLTPIGQQLGNRFLYLPEQKIKSDVQRSPISDITQCCGILFYAITGVQPVSLRDHEGKMPHERDEIQKNLSKFSTDVLNKLNYIFDIGFQNDIKLRWQSIEELKKALCNERTPLDGLAIKDFLNHAYREENRIVNNSTENKNLITYHQTGQFGIGHMSGGEIKSNAKVGGIINKNEKNEQQNLADINEDERQNLTNEIMEIQQILNQLSETYPTETMLEKIAIAKAAMKQIETEANLIKTEENSTLKQRLINAATEGGLAVIEKAFDNPIGALFVTAIKDWNEAE